MVQHAPAPTSNPTPDPNPKTEAETTGLAQQKADFTSEGSPPPGQVATTPPATETKPKRPAPHAASTGTRNNKQVPWGRSR